MKTITNFGNWKVQGGKDVCVYWTNRETNDSQISIMDMEEVSLCRIRKETGFKLQATPQYTVQKENAEYINVTYETFKEAYEVAVKLMGDYPEGLPFDLSFFTEETEEQNNVEHEEVETEGDGTNMTFYNSIYDYVQDADLSYYEIADGTIREAPFIEEIKPVEDPDFVISSDAVEHEGKWYRKVNFGENEESWLLESALYETVFLVYTEEDHGHYVTDGRVYEIEEEANASF